MSEHIWIRSHVERLLQEEWEACRVQPDDDDDYHFRRGTAACWVRLLDTADRPMIRVWAEAAIGVKASVAMWKELNDIQRRCLSTAVVWVDGRVLVSQTLSPIGLTGPVLAQALDAVGNVADDVGLLLAGMFGGSTPYPVDLEVST